MRHRRIRKKVEGTGQYPRLNVFRSNRYIYLQLIDDQKGKTLAAIDDRNVELEKNKKEPSKQARAFAAGRMMAKIAVEKKIKKIVFDRGGYRYHGRVKAAADGMREGGLEF